MSDSDDYAADALADRDVVECRECGGICWLDEETGDESVCPYCDGTGVWRSP